MSRFRFMRLVFAGLIMGMVFSVSSAYASHPWINANSYRVRPEGVIRFHLALGHNFPFGHSFFDNEQIGEMFIDCPEGERKEVGLRELRDGKLSQVQFELKSESKNGTYLVVMETKGLYGARTKEGFQRKSRKELEAKGEEIISKVSYAQMWAKAIVDVGEGGGESFSRIVGQGLEIVPLKNPNELRINDYFPIKVLLNGKPLEESVRVYAVPMGFSNEADVFAFSSWASARRGGEAKIRILQPGIWMIYVRARPPYPDQELADRFSLFSTLTFEVRH